MPDRRTPLGRTPLRRSDLPAEISAETIRTLPINTLRRLADHRNGILTRDEQRAFDAAIHQVMSGAADRVSRQLEHTDWAAVQQRQRGRRGSGQTRADDQLRRLTRRMDRDADLARTLAPGVDWSFAQGEAAPDETQTQTQEPPSDPSTPDPDQIQSQDQDQDQDQDGTVADLEARLTEQAELVDVMSEIAEVSRRTFALEQQRDLLTTRGVFFGFVVSVAVLVAGWAPLVAADWDERVWIIALTLGTCVVAGAVYALVRHTQNRRDSSDDDQPASTA